jgi:hypothetical protein
LNEDGAHLFFKCKTIAQVWIIASLEREIALLAGKNSARDVIKAVLAMKDDQKLKCRLTIWYCWTERNKIHDGERGRDASNLAHGIQVYQAAWGSLGCQVQRTALARTVAERAWERSPEDHVKVNCDAAFDPHTGSRGWGCILHDSDGDMIAARRGRLDALLEPLQGEIIACI